MLTCKAYIDIYIHVPMYMYPFIDLPPCECISTTYNSLQPDHASHRHHVLNHIARCLAISRMGWLGSQLHSFQIIGVQSSKARLCETSKAQLCETVKDERDVLFVKALTGPEVSMSTFPTDPGSFSGHIHRPQSCDMVIPSILLRPLPCTIQLYMSIL